MLTEKPMTLLVAARTPAIIPVAARKPAAIPPTIARTILATQVSGNARVWYLATIARFCFLAGMPRRSTAAVKDGSLRAKTATESNSSSLSDPPANVTLLATEHAWDASLRTTSSQCLFHASWTNRENAFG